MEISVIIPTYNNGEVLRETIRAARAQTLAAERYEIVVVDDGSTDGTADAVAELARAPGPAIRYVAQANRGRSAARNLGLRSARGRIAVFIDSDLWATPTLLAEHLAHYPSGVTARGVQGRTVPHPDSRVTPFMKVKETTPDLTMRRRHDLSPFHVTTRNCSMLRQDVLDAGGFDETFSGYGWEDIELAIRMHARGVRFEYEPAALGHHYHVESLDSIRRKLREAGAGAVYFWDKYGRPARLGVFLEILPAMLPLKWLVFRTPLFMPVLRRLLPVAERRGWLLLASECYNELTWEAYYDGVFAARRRLRHTHAAPAQPAARGASAGPARAIGPGRHTADGD
ncbi:MAG TPA: glycosyltransferase [bacterium]|nr:glycosyltransferase [bacterium]